MPALAGSTNDNDDRMPSTGPPKPETRSASRTSSRIADTPAAPTSQRHGARKLKDRRCTRSTSAMIATRIARNERSPSRDIVIRAGHYDGNRQMNQWVRTVEDER